MAKASKAKLKLFKTVIGFHDAYVAAASQKAALEAWGASTDLFSAGLAERVDDPAACEAAFADAGIRIDHALLNGKAARALKAGGVDREARSWPGTSDHGPVWIELEVR